MSSRRHGGAVARLEVHGAPDERSPDQQDEHVDEQAQTGSDEGRAARGALWFATNGIVVKGAQTLVLLTLAATLAMRLRKQIGSG